MSGYNPDAINEVLRSRSRNSRAQDTAGRGMSGWHPDGTTKKIAGREL